MQELFAGEGTSGKKLLSHETVALTVGEEQLASFFPLLQRGVTVQSVVGCSLNELLCRHLGIAEGYIAARVTTIFLNNSPLDDLETTIDHGARITLSGAMPGLVGAVMRRSGYYAAFRQGITYEETAARRREASGTITLKLFNLLLSELGPLVLSHGVLLEQEELNRLLQTLSPISIASSYRYLDNSRDPVLLTVCFK
jgi:hypothetical protein